MIFVGQGIIGTSILIPLLAAILPNTPSNNIANGAGIALNIVGISMIIIGIILFFIYRKESPRR